MPDNFLGKLKKPDVERIDGICPAIAIEQKKVLIAQDQL